MVMKMDEMHILYASDDNYAPIAGVSITSLFENNQDIDRIYVWYLADRISQENRRKLLKTADKYHRRITFFDSGNRLDEIKKTGVNAWFGGTFSAYSRLFLEEYIGDQEIERLLYLDCDTIVNQSIKKLWEYDLKGKTLGMVCDYIGAGIRDVIGLKNTDKYYNSGVLLIDMNLWKSHKCQEKILWHIENVNAKYPFIDQDIINIVLKDEIMTRPWNWNVFPYYFTYSFENIQKQYDLNGINQYSAEEYEGGVTGDGRPDAMIIHYTATVYGKPWYSNSCDPTKEIWTGYYERSVWKDSYQPVPLKLTFFDYAARIIITILPQKLYLLIFRFFSRRFMKARKKNIT